MEIDNRYWAGLFDGEGHIYFAKDLVHIKVSLTQKETAVLFLLKNRFGGYIHKYGKQTCHKWEVGGRKDMVAFLEAVKPYVIIKAVEVGAALEALSGFRQSRFYNSGLNAALPVEEMDRRRVLREKLMSDRADPKIEPMPKGV